MTFPINFENQPLKVFAVTILLIVGEVEHTCKPLTQRCKSHGGWEVHPQSTCTLVNLKRLALLLRLRRILKHPSHGHLSRPSLVMHNNPEIILPEDVAAEFAALDELKRTGGQNISGVEVLKGNILASLIASLNNTISYSR